MKENKKIIIANMKMNGSLSFNADYLNTIKNNFANYKNLNIGLCLPYPYLFQAKEFLRDTNIGWGSQNVAKFENGPHTGEVSAKMLKEFDSQYVIVGHSERSTAYCESDENIAAKFEKIKKYNMSPVLCVGETLIEREAGIMERVVSSQIDTIVKIYGAEIFENSIIGIRTNMGDWFLIWQLHHLRQIKCVTLLKIIFMRAIILFLKNSILFMVEA